MGAYVPDLGLDLLQIIEGLGAPPGIPEDGSRVVYGGHPHAGALHPLAVLPGDLEVRTNDTQCRHSAQADDDLRSDQGRLVAEIADTGILFGVQWVTVVCE